MSRAVAEDLNNGSSEESKQVGAEDLKSHDVPVSSGSEPVRRSHCGEKRDSVSSVSEPETTAPVDASERSVGSELSKQDTCLQELCTFVFDGLIVATRGCRHTTACCFSILVRPSPCVLHCTPPLFLQLQNVKDVSEHKMS